MNENKTSKTTTSLLATVIVLLIIIIAGGIFVFAKMMERKNEPEPSPAVHKIGMEANIITAESDFDEVEQNEPFSFTTWFQKDIFIKNGKDATCLIGNEASNYYDDMYIQIYINDENGEMSEENRIYLSKIIPRGSRIESFTAEREIEPGEYKGTLVYSCVDETGALAGDTPVIVDIHVE